MIDFAKNYESNISADDVLNSWDDVSDAVEAMSTDRRFALSDTLIEWCKDNKLKLGQARNLGKYAELLSGEELVNLWTKVSSCGNLNNVKAIHSQVGSRVVETVNKARNAGK